MHCLSCAAACSTAQGSPSDESMSIAVANQDDLSKPSKDIAEGRLEANQSFSFEMPSCTRLHGTSRQEHLSSDTRAATEAPHSMRCCVDDTSASPERRRPSSAKWSIEVLQLVSSAVAASTCALLDQEASEKACASGMEGTVNGRIRCPHCRRCFVSATPRSLTTCCPWIRIPSPPCVRQHCAALASLKASRNLEMIGSKNALRQLFGG
eukprot:3241337-Pleurochrysis_carterae.AAC.2